MSTATQSYFSKRDMFAILLRYSLQDDSVVERYAKYKGEKTPSLFDDSGNRSWDESKHPRVEKGSTSAHGGQFTSHVDSGSSDSPVAESATQAFIPLRERKAYAESMAKAGKSEQEIADDMASKGVALVDSRKLASDAVGLLVTSKPGIEMPTSTVPNEQAKPGDQLGLFGDAVKAPTKLFKPQLLENATKAKQGGLFDTHGNADQMDLFGDAATPDDMVYKPQVTQEQASAQAAADEAHKELTSLLIQKANSASKPASVEKVAGGKWVTKDQDDGKPIATSNTKREALEKAPTLGAAAPANAAVDAAVDKWKQAMGAIADFGEKIGGARKDTATPLGSRMKKEVDEEKSSQPAWRRKYEALQDSKTGKWFVAKGQMIQDPSTASLMNRIYGRRDEMFESKEAAEADIPLMEVKRNHGVFNKARGDEKPNWAIYRRVTDKKLPTVKGGFESRADAENYLKENAESIIEHKFPDWEDYSYLDHVDRKGKEHRPGDKDVKPKDFQEAFNFRGGEFGKWQMNQDGQTSLNHAYDGLHDLAETIGLPPKAMSLNGKLAIAFGSRGTGGKHSAKAHYEPDKEVINLTKMKGAGSLAHEWFHALDHYMAQQVHGPDRNGNKTESLLSERLPYGKEHKGRQEVVDAWKNLVNTMNSKTVDEKIQGNDKKLGHAKKTVGEVVDQLDEMIESNKRYNKRHKGLNEEQRKEWDAAKEQIKNLDVGSKTSIAALTEPDSKSWSSPQTFAPIQKLNELYKKATGRAFHTG